MKINLFHLMIKPAKEWQLLLGLIWTKYVNEEESTSQDTQQKSYQKKSGGWAMRIFKILCLLIIAPYILLFIYKVPQIHPVSTLMMKDYVSFQTVKRQWLPIDEMSSNLVNAVMMSEDGQFCSHQGIDWHQLTLVLNSASSGAPSRGASTIPMQLVKNLFLWQGRSYFRKVLEMPLALGADMILSKKRIMEIYLNIAEWGDGIYGAEAAAQHYFNKSARQLTLQQAALLAAALPNPQTRNPAKPNRAMQRVAKIIQTRAQKAGPYVSCVK